MGLDILPKSGINFRANSGAGNFSAKLNKLTRYEGGEFGMLKNNRKAISDAISKRASTIKLKGGLDRMQRKGAFLEIVKNDKTLTKEDKYKVKELLEYYARGKSGSSSKSTPTNKPAISIQRDDGELPVHRSNAPHEIDPNYFRSGNPVSHGADVSGRVGGHKLPGLGGPSGPEKMQKDSFSRLQGGAGPMVPPKIQSGGGIDLIKSL